MHSRRIGLYDNRGEKHCMNKLTLKQVIEILYRLSCGDTHAKLAKEFSVNKTCIGKIARRETWRNI
jgi:hypothetical protein